MPIVATAPPVITADLMGGRIRTLKESVGRRLRALYEVQDRTERHENWYKSLLAYDGILNDMFHRVDFTLRNDLDTLDLINKSLKDIPLVF